MGPWVLRSSSGAEEASFDKPSEFAGALRKAMTEAHRYRAPVRHLGAECRNRAGSAQEPEAGRIIRSPGMAPQLVNHLKQCAIALVKPEKPSWLPIRKPTALPAKAARLKIDKSVLTFGEPKRIRCKEHLRFVASQPCLICGRSPSHAHHVRYAQSRGLSLKVSDEFTVPLCAIHHHHIHTTGKEQEWWQERNIDPLIVASRLWQQSRELHFAAREPNRGEVLEDGTDKRKEAAHPSEPDTRLGDSISGAAGSAGSASREP